MSWKRISRIIRRTDRNEERQTVCKAPSKDIVKGQRGYVEDTGGGKQGRCKDAVRQLYRYKAAAKTQQGAANTGPHTKDEG